MHRVSWRVLWKIVNIFCLFAVLSYCFLIWNDLSSNLPGFLRKESERIDWNDYELMVNDALRTGFGEQGRGEKLTDLEEIKRNKKLFKTFGMSVVISDKISVNRSIPDLRHPNCMQKKYLRHLPRVSIIIIFNNEVFSVFKRTLHSLYNRTPHDLIEEVILVNDNSTYKYLYGPLKNYIDENFGDLNFEVINVQERVGLMRARVIGARAAKSDFLFIMEPHCDLTYNWLPPLIEPLLEERMTVTVPIVDNVEWNELTYYENDQGSTGCRGVFDWELEYQKLPRFAIANDKIVDPFATPVMTGGIFMIRKDYFFELGPYDEELLIWGAENIELSLKINLCGGRLLEVPCSRIGHTFRAFTRSRKHASGIDFLSFNRKRIVEVWFDEYKDYIYRRDRRKFSIDVGDIEGPRKLRETLNCKPFKYFLEVIAPDLVETFPYDAPSFASGRIQLEDSDFCLEAPVEPGMSFKLNNCPRDEAFSHIYELTWFRDIRLIGTNLCLDFYGVSLGICHLMGGNQLFRYDWKTKLISSPKNKQCLEADVDTGQLKFALCDETTENQRWIWTSFTNKTLLENWEKSGKPFGNLDYL